jgi:hypothetical protein
MAPTHTGCLMPALSQQTRTDSQSSGMPPVTGFAVRKNYGSRSVPIPVPQVCILTLSYGEGWESHPSSVGNPVQRANVACTPRWHAEPRRLEGRNKSWFN